jgi:hypothetical protein
MRLLDPSARALLQGVDVHDHLRDQILKLLADAQQVVYPAKAA